MVWQKTPLENIDNPILRWRVGKQVFPLETDRAVSVVEFIQAVDEPLKISGFPKHFVFVEAPVADVSDVAGHFYIIRQR